MIPSTAIPTLHRTLNIWKTTVGFYEAVYIFTDSGFAVVMIVPKEEGIDVRILELCAEFAIPAHAE